MDTQTSGGSRDLVDVLLTLGRLQRTGILTVQGYEQIIGITLLEGRIVSTDALNESLEEGLGTVLASGGLVSAEDFSSLVAEYEAGGGRVPDLLIERNYIDRHQLLDVQRSHTYQLCREVLSWDDCEFKFYAGTEVAHEEGMESIPIEELLVRASEELGLRGPLPGTMPLAGAVFAATGEESQDSGRDELLIGLATDGGEGESDLLAQVDGQRSVSDLAAVVGMSEFEGRLAFYLMERAGRVTVSDDGAGELLPQAGRKAISKVSEAGSTVAQVGARWLERGKASPANLERLDLSQIEWNAWPARILGIGAFVLLILLTLTDHGRFLLPFPWQDGLRQAVLDEKTTAAYLKIDRAAKTSFLLDGHFPERLDELVGDSHLTLRDLGDPAGRRLGFASQVAGYLIYPQDDRDASPGASRTETVTGNFLLDPEFVPEEAVEQPALVLID